MYLFQCKHCSLFSIANTSSRTCMMSVCARPSMELSSKPVRELSRSHLLGLSPGLISSLPASFLQPDEEVTLSNLSWVLVGRYFLHLFSHLLPNLLFYYTEREENHLWLPTQLPANGDLEAILVQFDPTLAMAQPQPLQASGRWASGWKLCVSLCISETINQSGL